ncbi:MAG: hypothetical protein UE630_04875 [Oscillospiraceae bacterium]|mgnify:FL=1|jgi:hypothetical protein|nr:hypothetical protein [Oscillospiraceae bacterium]
MKKKKRIVTIILWLAALAVLFIWSSPEQKVDRFVAKYAEVLEESLGTDLSGGYPGGLGIQYYNCWGEDSGHPIGEFCFGPSLLHGRQYYGCYYSPDDEPRGFQSVEVTLVPDGENCWTWHAEGDNRGMTKKIQDRWYYFEAWL